MKLTKENIDEVRNIEGFPDSNDEDIIALSNPPYYTACPNPYIGEFVEKNASKYNEITDSYHCEPFSADVSEGKYEPIYKLHPYHTKVPHKAIMRYILHYTKPGDLILDGFSGTGMTGVAAQLCGNPDAEFKLMMELQEKNIAWGVRKAILNDLSPAATFFAHNFTSSVDCRYREEAEKIIEQCKEKCDWMYETNHTDEKGQVITGFDGKPVRGRINFTVWSDVFICPHCGNEFVFWHEAVDKEAGKVKTKFSCSNCSIELQKKDCQHAKKVYYDFGLNREIEAYKQVPVLINYKVGTKKCEKVPDKDDLELIERIENMKLDKWVPTYRMIKGNEARRNDKSGITHVHQFYTKRNLVTLSTFKALIDISKPIGFALTKVANQMTKMYRFTYMNGCWGAGGGPMSGTLYIPSLVKELNMSDFLIDAINLQEQRSECKEEFTCITTQSTIDLRQINDNTIDYIFTDPPFGDNLSYSELNCIWESWLKVHTNNTTEAIINKSHNKFLPEYHNLMAKCFETYYRVLKPNRWITIEFHNSKNSVWNAIQASLQKAGFVVADIRTLDKKHSSFKQVNSLNSVKQDLVISAYKPKESFKKECLIDAGKEETAWNFVRQHLENLPVAVVKSGLIEIINERQAYLLFDRMVAFHIMNGIPVPIDSTKFYIGLNERFLFRDSMYFLSDQVNEYDNARIIADVEPIQMELFVTNEKSAIAWLYQQLEQPQSYSEIQPQFMQEVKVKDNYEVIPELLNLLEDNFLKNQENGKWYIPDVTKEVDLRKLREKKLLKEFETYLTIKGKLKNFRTEAIREGFLNLWAEKKYKLIVETAERLPESVVQEDDKLLMYYDISLGRV